MLGSTGSFKRFDSVDRNAHEGELIYGQTTLATPPWTTDETIPPQPLRPAPLPLAIRVKGRQNVTKQESFEPNSISAPLKSTPRPVPKKQMSAPSSCQIPVINPPERGFQKIVKDVQQATTTNPFLNGFVSFDSIKSNFFSTTVTTENERATKSASVSKNPFISTSSCGSDNNVFDFNPKTIKSIMEETPDDGYLGDNDENEDAADPLKQLEERIQKLEASGKQRRRSSGGTSSPKFSPNLLNKTSSNADNVNEISSVDEKFVNSSLKDESAAKSYRKHIRNRSFSENEASDLNSFNEDHQMSSLTTAAPLSSSFSTNPFLNGKRLLKTPSETYLEQFSMMRAKNNCTSPSPTMNNKSTQLCKHPSLNKILQSSQPLFENSESTQSLSSIKRALSSESISSESSVVMSTLERTTPPVTALLCIALQYDK